MMIYANQLPKARELEWLGKLASPYPVDRNMLVNISREYGFRAIVTKFLKLFPQSARFESRNDFVTRSVELQQMIAEERSDPIELHIKEED
jgi:hypothetical protein